MIFNLKTAVLKSSLCDFSNAYILLKGIIAVAGQGENDPVNANAGRNKKQAMLKNLSAIYRLNKWNKQYPDR